MTTQVLSAAAPYLIQQDYGAYTKEQHEVWSTLVGRALPELEKHAALEYLEGLAIITGKADGFGDAIPRQIPAILPSLDQGFYPFRGCAP